MSADPGAPAMLTCQLPSAFAGPIDKAQVDVTGPAIEGDCNRMRLHLARQWASAPLVGERLQPARLVPRNGLPRAWRRTGHEVPRRRPDIALDSHPRP